MQEKDRIMLELDDVKKDYVAGDTVVHALKGVSLQFANSGLIPSAIAAKKDPVVALRTE